MAVLGNHTNVFFPFLSVPLGLGCFRWETRGNECARMENIKMKEFYRERYMKEEEGSSVLYASKTWALGAK